MEARTHSRAIGFIRGHQHILVHRWGSSFAITHGPAPERFTNERVITWAEDAQEALAEFQMLWQTGRPSWWNSLYDRAIESLTHQWQDYGQLKRAAGLDYLIYDHLSWSGWIEKQTEQLYRDGYPAGSKSRFRLLGVA